MDQNLFNEISRERRARLATERTLERKQKELESANRRLSSHSLTLSERIIDQRRVVEELSGENSKVSKDLETAQHKAVVVERLLWDALEAIKDGFALFDADRRLIAANGPYLATLENTNIAMPGVDFEDILDHCIEEGLVDLQDEDEDDWFDRMLNRWEAVEIAPETIRLWNGRYIKMMDRHTDDGGIVSLALDITDSMQREARLEDALEKANAADRAKSAFLAKMSHELRTPMNGVVGMAELLLEDEEDEDRRLYASTIRNSSIALLEIINDVLDFSKIEADKLTLKPKPFDLKQLIEDVALIVEPTVRQKRIRLLVDFDQHLPKQFIGDPGRIRQIVTNLVGNAVKFTETGHVLIRATGKPSDDTAALFITIEDTGIGIEPEKTRHIFGEFNQVENDANRKYEGTGLGLAITRKLVEQMEGSVSLESASGEGSCFGFSLTLPIAQSDTPAPRPFGKPTLKRALIVHDKPVEASIIAQQLDLLGVETSQSATVKDGNFDLVLLPPHLSHLLAGQENVVWIGEGPAHGSILERPFLLESLRGIVNCNAAPQRKPMILAAEDNKTNQLVFRKMLKNLDVDLLMVGDGKKALEQYRTERPDIIFMDISMPEMDGMEATRHIRADEDTQGDRIPIVAMTAHAMAGDEDRIRDAGVDHYLTKPLKKAQILAALEEHLPKTMADGLYSEEPLS